MTQFLSSHCFSVSSNPPTLSMLGDGGNGAKLWPREWPLALSARQGESYRGTGKEWINFSVSPHPVYQAAAFTPATHTMVTTISPWEFGPGLTCPA